MPAVQMSIWITPVPIDHLETCDKKVQAILEKVVKEGIDMKQMSVIVRKAGIKVSRRQSLH